MRRQFALFSLLFCSILLKPINVRKIYHTEYDLTTVLHYYRYFILQYLTTQS